eukprot:403363259
MNLSTHSDQQHQQDIETGLLAHDGQNNHDEQRLLLNQANDQQENIHQQPLINEMNNKSNTITIQPGNVDLDYDKTNSLGNINAYQCERTLAIKKELLKNERYMEKVKVKNLKAKGICNLENGKVQLFNSVDEYTEDFTYFNSVFTYYGSSKATYIKNFVQTDYHTNSYQKDSYIRDQKAYKEAHKPDKGWTHPFQFQTNTLTDYLGNDYIYRAKNCNDIFQLRNLFKCDQCGERFQEHQESQYYFKTGNIGLRKNIQKLFQRQHSFEQHELSDLKKQYTHLFPDKNGFNINLLGKNAETFNCRICYMDVSMQQIKYLNCGHYFCEECFKAYIEYMINNGHAYQIKCPDADCQVEFLAQLMKEILSENMFEKYKRLQLNIEVSKSRNKKFCPIPSCENVIEVKQSNTKKVQCQKCKNDICFKCQIKWHEGITCAKAQEKLYKGWAANYGAHKCPSCQAPVEKNEGCPHMNCSMCGYRWCWGCGQKSDHWSHALPIMCLLAPNTPKAFALFVLIFILGLALIPVILVLGACFFTIYGGCGASCGCLYLSFKLNKFFGILMIPFAIVFFGISAAVCLAVLCVAAALAILPIYFLHIYLFYRAVYWWCKPRVKEQKQSKNNQRKNQIREDGYIELV